EMGGFLIGAKWLLDEDPPFFEIQLAVGPIFGRLDIDISGFGSFKSAVGVEARVSAVAWLHPRIGLVFWLDFRQIAVNFNEPAVSGDSSAGGSMFAVGVGLVRRF